MDYPGFVGGSYVSQSLTQDNESTVNFYVEAMEGPGGKSRLALYPTPGVSAFVTRTANSAGRGALAVAGRAFAVIGGDVCEVDVNGTLTVRGTVAIDTNPATLSYNGDGGGELFITSGNNGYIFDLNANTLTQVRTGATRMGAYLDGRFIALDTDTSTAFLSGLLDGTTWDPLLFVQPSTQADRWVSMHVIDRYVWFLGEHTSSVWFTTQDAANPIQQHPSGLVEYGCGAPFSPKVVAGSLFWLSQTRHGRGQVIRATGFTPTVVSTYAVSVALEAMPLVSDAIGDIEERQGHSFYLLSLPTANATLCYDASANAVPESMRWTNRGTWDAAAQRYNAWRPLYHVFIFDRILVLDRAGANIYEVTTDTWTDVDGLPIRRLRRAPSLWSDNKRLAVSRFEVHVETGVGSVTGQGEQPQLMLRHSGDAGRTWGAERWRSLGKLGEYGTRVQWHLCGSGRQWVPEVVITDPVACRITGASVTLRKPLRQAA